MVAAPRLWLLFRGWLEDGADSAASYWPAPMFKSLYDITTHTYTMAQLSLGALGWIWGVIGLEDLIRPLGDSHNGKWGQGGVWPSSGVFSPPLFPSGREPQSGVGRRGLHGVPPCVVTLQWHADWLHSTKRQAVFQCTGSIPNAKPATCHCNQYFVISPPELHPCAHFG